jgi:transposase
LYVREISVSSQEMKPYSADLRERIIRELEAQAETQPEIAERVAVSLSFVEKVWRRWRATGSCAALPHAGGRQRSLAGRERVIRAEIARDPDLTLASLCERIAQGGGPQVSAKTLCVELQRLHLPLKKSPSMPVSERRPG